MKRPAKQDLLSFLDRCLEDVENGTLYLSKQDRERNRKAFALAGRDVRHRFADQADLLRTYLRGLPPERFYIVYETARLLSPELADPLDDFDRWPEIDRADYLAIRILVKLNVLRVDLDQMGAWIRDHLGECYLTAEGGLDFDNEVLVLELDRELAPIVSKKLAREELAQPDDR